MGTVKIASIRSDIKKAMTIIDGHVHTFPNDEISNKITASFNRMYNIEFPNLGTGSIDDVLKNMERFGIDYTIMANFAPAKILHSNNLWALNISRQHRSLIPLVSFHPDMEGGLRDLLEVYVDDGARGIKIHPMAQSFNPCHDRLSEVYSFCNNVSLPVVFHCGRVANARLNEYADIDMILPVIKKYPRIPVILTHMADGNKDTVLELAKVYSNVYFDTSIVITGYPPIMDTNDASWLDDSEVEEVINTIGADRIVFGSDYPWGSPGHDIGRLLRMKLDDAQKSLILGMNSMKLFNICK